MIKKEPSLWYIPLVGGENFFDGFGFSRYRERFKWKQEIPIDRHEKLFSPQTATAAIR